MFAKKYLGGIIIWLVFTGIIGWLAYDNYDPYDSTSRILIISLSVFIWLFGTLGTYKILHSGNEGK